MIFILQRTRQLHNNPTTWTGLPCLRFNFADSFPDIYNQPHVIMSVYFCPPFFCIDRFSLHNATSSKGFHIQKFKGGAT